MSPGRPHLKSHSFPAGFEPLYSLPNQENRTAWEVLAPRGFSWGVGELHGCPCGVGLPSTGNGGRQCTCSPTQVRRYLGKISGPLLDRIDIHIEVPRLSPQQLMSKQPGETSAAVRERVVKARLRQGQRYGEQGDKGVTCNAQLRAKQLREHCQLDGVARDLLRSAIDQFGLSARAYDRILKVSRTVADLDNSDDILLHHVAEAINYRTLDRQLFG